jgi:oxalyl-CoA decarboxylase
LARLAQAEGIRYIGFRHEQSAGNAAAIVGYLTKKPGICLTVSAPGFLNGMVALANATTNGFPMIQISGSSDREIVDLQQGDYEELDQMNVAKPYTKAAFRVSKPEDIGIGVARAIHAAVSDRPGGVYLDLTADVLAATLESDAAKRSLVRVVDPAPRRIPDAGSIKRHSICWPARSVRSSFSAKVPHTHRLTKTFGHSSRRPASRTCRCRWRRASCRTITNSRRRHALSFSPRPM